MHTNNSGSNIELFLFSKENFPKRTRYWPHRWLHTYLEYSYRKICSGNEWPFRFGQ